MLLCLLPSIVLQFVLQEVLFLLFFMLITLFLQACSYLFSALREVLVHEQNTSIFRSNDQYKQNTKCEKSLPGHVHVCSATCTVAAWRCSCAREGCKCSASEAEGFGWCLEHSAPISLALLRLYTSFHNGLLLIEFSFRGFGRLVCLTE